MPTLDWIGKKAVVNHHREVPYRLVHCDSELSAGDADAGNLLVEGDNLEALKALLPYYAGKVKCIYIDPPYNTGNEDWVYNDNVNSPEIKKWLNKAVGKEANDLSRHDKWLCMMYPRLRLLREFLREDGVIFVSIDDDENHHLRILLDEIFGLRNRLGTIVWKKKTNGNNVGQIPPVHDFIFAYGRMGDDTELRGELIEEAYIAKNYKNPDNHPLGAWGTMDLSANHEGPYFSITNPITGKVYFPPKGRYWVFSEEEVKKRIDEGRIIFGKTGKAGPIQRIFLEEKLEKTKQLRKKSDSLWDGVALNSDGTAEISDILEAKAFQHPKPSNLISKLIDLVAEKNDLILDSFSGSGSTGHAVLNLNKQDGGNRRFILVELDQKIAQEIAAKRLYRVIRGYDCFGKKMIELFSKKLTLETLKDADNLLDVVEDVQTNNKEEYLEIKTTLKDGELRVTGLLREAGKIPGLGGGFRYCRLGVPLFNEFGDIDGGVNFADLAAHIFFTETGAPVPNKANGTTPFIGQYRDKALYLLFSPSEPGFAREASGNVLTPAMLDELPEPADGFEGQKIIFGEGCTISKERLKTENIVFKQIPYQVEGKLIWRR